jgi:hypothetical protein
VPAHQDDLLRVGSAEDLEDEVGGAAVRNEGAGEVELDRDGLVALLHAEEHVGVLGCDGGGWDLFGGDGLVVQHHAGVDGLDALGGD